jgi:hypothetical protein
VIKKSNLEMEEAGDAEVVGEGGVRSWRQRRVPACPMCVREGEGVGEEREREGERARGREGERERGREGERERGKEGERDIKTEERESEQS